MSDQVERFKLWRGPTGFTFEPLGDTPSPERGDAPIEVIPVSDHRSVVERLEGELDQTRIERDQALTASANARDYLAAERHRREKAEAERNQATTLVHKAIEEFERRAETVGALGLVTAAAIASTFRVAAVYLRDQLSSPPEHQAEGRLERYQAALREIAGWPTVERNPDGVDQAAHSMQLIARTALEGKER